MWGAAITVTMALTALILLAGERLQRWMGDRAMQAIERLMGLILTRSRWRSPARRHPRIRGRIVMSKAFTREDDAALPDDEVDAKKTTDPARLEELPHARGLAAHARRSSRGW